MCQSHNLAVLQLQEVFLLLLLLWATEHRIQLCTLLLTLFAGSYSGAIAATAITAEKAPVVDLPPELVVSLSPLKALL